jgi:hypothetical protein
MCYQWPFNKETLKSQKHENRKSIPNVDVANHLLTYKQA